MPSGQPGDGEAESISRRSASTISLTISSKLFERAPAQFPPDLARVTSLLWRIHRTLKPGIDVDKSTPVGDANAPERGRDEVSNRVAFAARDDEVIGCRVAPDQLKRACVIAGKTPVTTCFEVADA